MEPTAQAELASQAAQKNRGKQSIMKDEHLSFVRTLLSNPVNTGKKSNHLLAELKKKYDIPQTDSAKYQKVISDMKCYIKRHNLQKEGKTEDVQKLDKKREEKQQYKELVEEFKKFKAADLDKALAQNKPQPPVADLEEGPGMDLHRAILKSKTGEQPALMAELFATAPAEKDNMKGMIAAHEKELAKVRRLETSGALGFMHDEFNAEQTAGVRRDIAAVKKTNERKRQRRGSDTDSDTEARWKNDMEHEVKNALISHNRQQYEEATARCKGLQAHVDQLTLHNAFIQKLVEK